MKKYLDKSNDFLKAVEIAKKILKRNDALDPVVKESLLKFADQIEEMVSNPEPEFKNLGSLSSLEKDFLGYWNEAQGSHIDLFWEEISANNLPFRRENVLSRVLKRKRIKDIHEYDTVKDSILIALQKKDINEDEFISLNNYLTSFEKKVGG